MTYSIAVGQMIESEDVANPKITTEHRGGGNRASRVVVGMATGRAEVLGTSHKVLV